MQHTKGIEIAWPFIGPVQNGGGVAPYYGPGSPFTSPTDFVTHMTGNWAQLTSAGYTFVRIPFPPGVLIDCLGNATQTNIVMGVLLAAVQAVNSNGFGCLICLEDSFDVTAYAPAALLASGISSAIWQDRVTVTGNIAAWMAANFTTAQVALELFNEPPPVANISVSTWSQYQQTLWNAARAAAPGFELLVTGPNYSDIPDLIALTPSNYDDLTGFVFHCYLPYIFAQQGYQNGFNNWVNGLLAWPINPSQESTAISGMTSNVNADPSVPSGDKASTIASQTTQIDDFFGAPEDINYCNELFDPVVEFCNANNLAPSRIWVTEFGTTRTNSGGYGGTAFTGVDQTSRSNWKAAMLSTLESRDFRTSEFAYDDPRYGITSGTGVTIGTINT